MSEAKLPKASFNILVTQLATQALMELGAIPNPVSKDSAVSLPRARFTIDLLEVLSQRTEGNLEPEEQNYLEQVLYDLRLKYVEQSQESGGTA